MKKCYLFASILLIIALLPYGKLSAQEWLLKEIEAFKQEEQTQGITKNGILFLGSSSFRMWKTVKTDFPEYPIVKRGFGGSSMKQAIIYFDDLVKPHDPSQIIIYFGDNDLSGNSYSVESFMKDVQCFVRMVELNFPKTKMCFVSIKPSPSRRANFPKYIEANRQLKMMCDSADDMQYIDIWTPMTDKDNFLKDKTMFLPDSLHMTAKGYELWKEIIGPYLLK